MLLGILILLFREDWRIGLVLLGFSAVTAVAVEWRRRVGTRYFVAPRQAKAELFGFLEERLVGLVDIQAVGAREYVVGRLYRHLRAVWATARRSVVMSDVIYYEPEPAKLWTLLPNLVTPGGIVIIRVPNRLSLIRLAQAIRRFVTSKRARDMRDRIMFFNPEHLFIFSRRLLTRRLSSLGFDPVTVLPSELKAKDETPAAKLPSLSRPDS